MSYFNTLNKIKVFNKERGNYFLFRPIDGLPLILSKF